MLEICWYNMPIFKRICFEIRIQNKTSQRPGFLMYLVFGKDSSCGFNQFFRNFSQKSKFTHFHQTLLCMHCLNFCFMDSLDVTLYQNRFRSREKGMHYTSFLNQFISGGSDKIRYYEN